MIWRLAFRSLRSTPVSTTMAVLSLALGIGATTALFSILNSLLLQTLPVREPAGLVQLANTRGNNSWTNLQWEQIRGRPDLAGGAVAWSSAKFNVSPSGQTEFIDGVFASGGFFDVLGVPTVLGRAFAPADDARGGGPDGPVAVISHAYWQRRFGGDAGVVGQRLTLERVPFTIIGVAPPRFFGLDIGGTFDVIVPIGTEPLMRGADTALDHRSYWWLSVMLRLRPGQSAEDATAAIRAVQPQIREATVPGDWPPSYLESYLKDAFTLVPCATGDSYLRDRYRRPLATLMVAVGLLLLIACANIANLMLARATSRRHEMAVSAALGASRWALARPLLAESLLLSAAGALAGLTFAQWSARLLVAALSTTVNRVFLDLSLNWTVLGFTLVVMAGAAVIFGVAPALKAAQAKPQEALGERGRGTAGTGHANLGSALVVAQVALSLVLVISAGLFARTFAALATLDLGFDRDPVLVAGVNARRSAEEPAARLGLFERVRDAARAVPGVAHAALSVVTPVSGSTWSYGVGIVGEPPRSVRDRGTHVNLVTPGWFAAYGTRILAGRDIGVRDVPGAPPVALVNETFVRQFLNGSDPIGRQIEQLPAREPETSYTIIGVVQDAVYRSLREPVPPTMYLAFAQRKEPGSQASLSVRSAGPPPATLIRPLAAALGGVDGNLSYTFRLLSDQVGGALVQERLVALLSIFFGALALLLAALGLYGVTSYAVSRRRAEMGIRLALGGPPAAVVRLVLRRVVGLVVAGVLVGSVAAYWAARFVQTLVYGVPARDEVTFAGAIVVLVTSGVVAGWLPARRASRIDPASVLRES